jgi:hypothetical protein
VVLKGSLLNGTPLPIAPRLRLLVLNIVINGVGTKSNLACGQLTVLSEDVSFPREGKRRRVEEKVRPTRSIVPKDEKATDPKLHPCK